MTRETALVIAPGRGTYNKDELGYLHRFHPNFLPTVERFDGVRRARGQDPLVGLDGAGKFSLSKFTRGDNASGLIYACAYADYLAIDRERFDVAAVTGNSMGWYIALACAGALDADGGFAVVNTMGTLMQESLIGGQMIYPFVGDDWREIPGRREALLELIDRTDGLYLSIELGGMIVFGGDEAGLAAAEAALEPIGDRFPMRLSNHAAFHTALQKPVSGQGREALAPDLFRPPTAPMIDGRGAIWQPWGCDTAQLWDYTLGTQVVEPYDFTAAIRTGVREFAPDRIIILGPGATLGGAVAQALIGLDWRGMTSKAAFIERQRTDPLVLSMGMPDQRAQVTA